jgi:shikimate 5-dehydrogenase
MLEKLQLRPKNSGGGIAPAAIGALIEAGCWSVNVFRRNRNGRKAVAQHR